MKITSAVFFGTFPFIVVFNRGMRVRCLGMALMRIAPSLIGRKINQEYVLTRPMIKFKWEDVSLSRYTVNPPISTLGAYFFQPLENLEHVEFFYINL